MKKRELFHLGKDFGLKIKDIENIILNRADLTSSQLFLFEDIKDKYIEQIKLDFLELKKGKQIEYILKQANFYNLSFYVDNRVLIPREETEIMVDEVLNEINKIKEEKITLIDIGTGSSCIPISILKNTSNINNCYVADISKRALDVAKININKYGLQDKVSLLNEDLFTIFLDGKLKIKDKKVIITANLPYIKQDDFKNIDKSVVDYEPSMALYGGEKTGFELYEKLINQILDFKKMLCHSEFVSESGKSKNLLNKKILKQVQNDNLDENISLKYIKKIILFIEIGFDQYEISKTFLKNKQLKFEYFKDNNKIRRIIKINF